MGGERTQDEKGEHKTAEDGSRKEDRLRESKDSRE